MNFLIFDSHFSDLETHIFAQIEWCSFKQIWFFITTFSSLYHEPKANKLGINQITTACN